jgi:hypothetical protein
MTCPEFWLLEASVCEFPKTYGNPVSLLRSLIRLIWPTLKKGHYSKINEDIHKLVLYKTHQEVKQTYKTSVGLQRYLEAWVEHNNICVVTYVVVQSGEIHEEPAAVGCSAVAMSDVPCTLHSRLCRCVTNLQQVYCIGIYR